MFSRSRIASNNRAASGRADPAGAVVPTAPCPAPAASSRDPRGGRRASQPGLLRPLAPSNRPLAVRHSMFGPSPPGSGKLLWPLLTPAAPSRRLAAPVAHLTTGADRQVSQGKTRDLRPTYPPHIRPDPPGDIGLRVSRAPSPRSERLLCGSCSSGQDFACSCLQTPPRDDALAVRLTVPVTRARRGLPPPSRPSRHHSETTSAVMALRAMPGAHRVGGRLAAALLPHHRAYGSVHGGS